MFGLRSKYQSLLSEIAYEKECRRAFDSNLIKKNMEINERIDALMDYLGVEEKQSSGIQLVKKESKK